MPTYNPPTGKYTSKIPSGTQGFRKFLASKFSFTRTEVIRDRSRCQAKSSEHCECRAIDFFTKDTAKGNKVFDWCVANAEGYNIQSVIWQHRQWGFGKWYERNRAKSDHFDHVHVGLNLKGAKSFEEDEMTPEEKKLLEALKKEVFTKGGRSRIDSLDERVKKLEGR